MRKYIETIKDIPGKTIEKIDYTINHWMVLFFTDNSCCMLHIEDDSVYGIGIEVKEERFMSIDEKLDMGLMTKNEVNKKKKENKIKLLKEEMISLKEWAMELSNKLDELIK